MKSIIGKYHPGRIILLGITIFQILCISLAGASVMDEWGEGLGQSPHSVHSFLFEVTFMNIDVAVIQYQLDSQTAKRSAEITQSCVFNDSSKDQVGDIFLASETIAFSMDLQRDASCGRVLKGMLSNLKRARESGFVSIAEHDSVSIGLPALLSPHEERGVLKGDLLMFRVQPEGTRVILLDGDRHVLVDSLEEGNAWVQGIKGIFLGQDSKLRDRVVAAAWGLN